MKRSKKSKLKAKEQKKKVRYPKKVKKVKTKKRVVKPKKVEKLKKKKEEIKSLIVHAEDQYKEAKISEETYSEIKEKNLEEIKKIDNKLGSKSKKDDEEIEEMTPEVIERLAEKVKTESKLEEIKEEEEEKKGILGKLFKKKKKKVSEVVAEGEETIPETTVGTISGMELEKIKIMLEAMKESKSSSDERIQTLAENIGELRSMVFRADADTKEISSKTEKIETEISGIRPREIEKKIKERDEKIEKHMIKIEKIERVIKDLGEKINKTYDMLKEMGGVENLAELNLEIKEKINDIKELVKYVERIGAKVERMSIDMGKNLEDFVVYKVRLDSLEDSSKDILKSIDSLNLKIGDLITKKDWDKQQEEILEMRQQQEEMIRELPVLKSKVPETIKELRKEKDDIKILLNSLREGYQKGKMTKDEYKEIERSNKRKLEEIEKNLAKEWKRIKGVLATEEGVGEMIGEGIEEKAVEKEKKIKEKKVKKKVKKKPIEKVKEVKKVKKVESEEVILKDILKGV